MAFDRLSRDGIVLLGCGKMGGAMLKGWLGAGLSPSAVHVRDPKPGDELTRLAGQGLHLNEDLPAAPAMLLVAVKPQMMGDALPAVAALGGGATVVLSIAAGTTIARFEEVFGAGTPVVRAMPNTPAAIGKGITAIIGNAHVAEEHMQMAEKVLGAIGQTVRLDTEEQMNAVTGVSGSGPAYVFHMIEALAEAGAAEGLTPDLAMQLAIATVSGAGQLAATGEDTPEELRINVTSPNGTTQAGLEVLMDEAHGLRDLMRRTVAAAAARSRALSD